MIVNLATKADWKVLSECYFTQNQSMDFECPANHKISVKPSIFEIEQICIVCSRMIPKYKKIFDRAEEIGWQLITEQYIDSITPMEFICSNNHRLNMRPSNFMTNPCCKECGLLEKYDNLKKYLSNYGWTVITENYVNNHTLMKFRCLSGHIRTSDTTYIKTDPRCQQCEKISDNKLPKKRTTYNDIILKAEEHGWKVISKEYNSTRMTFICHNERITRPYVFLKSPSCIKCTRISDGEKKFRINVEKFGGKILGTYINSTTRIKCICSRGHECAPSPHMLIQGKGLCPKCSKCCPVQAAENFYYNVEKVGGTCIGEYINCDTRVECRCVNQHICYPMPSMLDLGYAICRQCSGTCPIQSEKKFQRLLKKLNAKIIGEYKGVDVYVKCECHQGHICYALPSAVIYKKTGICSECAGNSPEASEKYFRKSLLEAKFIMIGNYVNNHTKIEVLCPNKYKIMLTSDKVRQQGVFCKYCSDPQSNLEKITADALKILKYNYEPQFIYEL
jgi:hypothetical protein